MTDTYCTPTRGQCWVRDPEHRRQAHPYDSFHEYRIENNGDGTWCVREYTVNQMAGKEYRGNGRSFPSRAEAEVYAHSRNHGGLDIGALMSVHDWRLVQARRHYERSF